MKVVGIVQARLGSSRLPEKALADIGGRPMLAHEVERLQACRSIDELVIATTEEPADAALVDLAAELGIGAFRGSEANVLERVLGAATAHGADVVVRVTGDCPLIDPGVVDLVVGRLVGSGGDADYASNVLRRTYPRGLDAEAMTLAALRRAGQVATSAEEREHVTLVMRRADEAFRTLSIEDDEDNSDLRLTVDEPHDLQLVRALYDALSPDGSIWSFRAIVAHLRAHPELQAINAGIETWSPLRTSSSVSTGRVA